MAMIESQTCDSLEDQEPTFSVLPWSTTVETRSLDSPQNSDGLFPLPRADAPELVTHNRATEDLLPSTLPSARGRHRLRTISFQLLLVVALVVFIAIPAIVVRLELWSMLSEKLIISNNLGQAALEVLRSS
jgi:hypothetical protein